MIDLVSLLDGNTFLVSDRNGDIEQSPNSVMRLFSFDTRFISTWVLTINGERLSALSVDDLQYFETRFFLVPGASLEYLDSKVSIVRQRSIGGSFNEELKILSFNDRSTTRACLDRPVRRPGGQRLHLVRAEEYEDRPREPMLERLMGLDLVPRR